MSSSGPDDPKESPAELLSALRHSYELLGKLLHSHHAYLLKIIGEEIDPRLNTRLGASDIVQDAYLRVLENFRRATEGIFSVGTEADLRRWLRQVGLNTLFQEHRDEGREIRDFRKDQPIETEYAPPDDAPSPSSICARKERDERVTGAVNALPEVDRILFRLRELHSWTYAALAGLLDGDETERGRVGMQRRITKIRFELERDDSLKGPI